MLDNTDYYNYYIFAHCDQPLHAVGVPENEGGDPLTGTKVTCGPDGLEADERPDDGSYPAGAIVRNKFGTSATIWTGKYNVAGTYTPRVYVEWVGQGSWCVEGGGAASDCRNDEDQASLAVEPFTSAMDVTPDEPAGPNGDTTLAVGEAEVYSATWSWSGESPKWRMWAENSSGTIVSGTDTGQRTLIDPVETHQNSMSFSAVGEYEVCAWGSAEEPDAVAAIERDGLFGFLLDIAHAARTGAGVTDVECKDVTVTAPEEG